MINSYVSGSLVRVTGTFTDVNGSLVDPTTVTLKYKVGGGSIITLTFAGGGLTKQSTGIYYVDLDTTGFTGPNYQTWTLEWIGTGTCVSISNDTFNVTVPALGS